MRNPIKELKGIKDSINEVKQTMDGIKGTLDDVKGDVDQVQKRLQNTMDHAKQTSEKAQSSTQQLKQSLQKANTGMTQSKKHIASTKKDIQQGVSIVKGLFGVVTQRTPAEESGYTATDRAADQASAGAQLIEGGQLYQEGTAFFLKKEEQVIGEITYIPGPFSDTWTLNHTYVHPDFRGGNIAKGLLDQVVNAARAENKKILPACSYAAVQFKRDSSYNDVWWKE
ncbi:GNAT family N-acetyltransferase [Paenibacillus sp. WLX2291]|uniref:GNAT family N-acetyltransferase n=1 Tax=Paenibacillus sp. WLX2291 TaxID=3296934 RepID=UPI003983E75A